MEELSFLKLLARHQLVAMDDSNAWIAIIGGNIGIVDGVMRVVQA
jgi:hypothetical protein